ncbi:uncharacterized protein BX663DRAFT_509263 [Cokeromyces recurvatus]|uniref:uncharacterized protein n=1 Tax=Cokeromyces recurvatus TaxID=90255 RepID=UPI00221FDB0D|nr:uncharacterized protein BX663DRAFT_509263 [Cokeromyces recurvatus]KAI7903021.1 hypothetical protein BX663DRAFT_509263 [Cokeromyces recurvatus]
MYFLFTRKFILSSFITAVIASSSFVNAVPITNTSISTYYPLTTIVSQEEFCLFLPPKPGLEIALNEDNGIPFCTNKSLVYNATEFPEGFITTAHYYLKNDSYVQVTGFFNRTHYSLNATDGGGQYDNHDNGKPIGAKCKGYKYFVSMIEPDVERFCIRCCQEKADCNTGLSQYGCLRIINGDYNRDNNFISGNNSTNNATHLNNIMNNNSSIRLELRALSASTDSVTNPNDAITAIVAEIKNFEESNQKNSPDQVLTQWNGFSSYLINKYPRVSNQINQ